MRGWCVDSGPARPSAPGLPHPEGVLRRRPGGALPQNVGRDQLLQHAGVVLRLPGMEVARGHPGRREVGPVGLVRGPLQPGLGLLHLRVQLGSCLRRQDQLGVPGLQVRPPVPGDRLPLSPAEGVVGAETAFLRPPVVGPLGERSPLRVQRRLGHPADVQVGGLPVPSDALRGQRPAVPRSIMANTPRSGWLISPISKSRRP